MFGKEPSLLQREKELKWQGWQNAGPEMEKDETVIQKARGLRAYGCIPERAGHAVVIVLIGVGALPICDADGKNSNADPVVQAAGGKLSGEGKAHHIDRYSHVPEQI